MEEALIKRILPHSIEAEQSVIGSMILDRDAILVASEILTPSPLSEPSVPGILNNSPHRNTVFHD